MTTSPSIFSPAIGFTMIKAREEFTKQTPHDRHEALILCVACIVKEGHQRVNDGRISARGDATGEKKITAESKRAG